MYIMQMHRMCAYVCVVGLRETEQYMEQSDLAFRQPPHNNTMLVHTKRLHRITSHGMGGGNELCGHVEHTLYQPAFA